MADQPFDMQISGLTEVEKVFFNLPNSTAKKAYMPALKAGGKVVAKLARMKVKAIVSNEATGTLAKNISVYSLKKYQGNFRVGVMIRRGSVNTLKVVNGAPVRVGLYGSVLEYREGGRFSWLRTSAREGTQSALAAILAEMTIRMDDAIKDAKK
jgi:Bacteriophage HK97-gp10, putative tail-component